jgi:hypothetical protein
VETHGDIGGFSAVGASTEQEIMDWMAPGGGMVFNMMPVQNVEEPPWWEAVVFYPWLEDNWKAYHNLNKAIVIFIACHSAEGGIGYSCVASAGGRVGFGYEGEPSQQDGLDDVSLLFARMKGASADATKRTAGKAYADGASFHGSFKMIGNGCGQTHKWTVLCPSPNALFPWEPVGARRGAGCIVFDTYMDIGNAADEAVIVASGAGGCSPRRWFGNAAGAYGISFDFDKRIFVGGILMRAVAEKCAANALFGWGMGSKLDGDRVAPNRDDREWDF